MKRSTRASDRNNNSSVGVKRKKNGVSDGISTQPSPGTSTGKQTEMKISRGRKSKQGQDLIDPCFKNVWAKEVKRKGTRSAQSKRIDDQSLVKSVRSAVSTVGREPISQAQKSLICQMDAIDRQFEENPDNVRVQINENKEDKFPEVITVGQELSQAEENSSEADSDADDSDFEQEEDLNNSIDSEADMASKAETVQTDNVVKINTKCKSEFNSFEGDLQKYDKLRQKDPAFNTYIKKLLVRE